MFAAVSCGPTVKTFEGRDFTVDGPASLEVSSQDVSKRGAVSSSISLEDKKTGDVYNIEVFYAEMNPSYLLEDYYGEEPDSLGDGVYVSYMDWGDAYAFCKDSCTISVMLPGEGTLKFEDFTNWAVNHDKAAVAKRCGLTSGGVGDAAFLYETYGTFSPNIDYALTDDNISMRRFDYNPETNTVYVTIWLRRMTRDGYLNNEEANNDYLVSRVRDFAKSTGLYYTYCRSKNAGLEISVEPLDGTEVIEIKTQLM